MDTLREQIGFTGLLQQADTDNRRHRFERASAHLPREIEAAIRYHRQQIKDYHAAMQALDIDAAERINAEAHLMAVRVNHGDAGILATKDAPGYVISRRCAARAGDVPMFGQEGRFTLTVAGVEIRIAMDGMFGLGGARTGFSARAADLWRPFISETGFRSFLAAPVRMTPGMTTAEFAERAIADHIAGELKGKLRPIDPRYRPAPSPSPGQPQ
jgi:hypothetical protein